MLERIESLRAQASEAIAAAPDLAALEELRVRYLGRKSELTSILRGISELEPSERGPVGSAANAARLALETELESRLAELEAAEIEASLAGESIDVTLPGAAPVAAGHLHLLTRTRREIEDVFVGLGYRVLEGPEIEHDFYNFTALNHPPGHPARQAQDSFYLDPATLASDVVNDREPGAGAAGRAASNPYIADAGARDGGSRSADLRRRARHRLPARHDRRHPLADVPPGRGPRGRRGPLTQRSRGHARARSPRHCSDRERETRLKPDYFPFTEPSVQVDVSCFACEGSGRLADGSRDSLCKGTGWIEILGAGMVDPNVFGFVEGGYDPETTQGFAFGIGIERVAMLKHRIPDLRLFFENDVRFLRQFA